MPHIRLQPTADEAAVRASKKLLAGRDASRARPHNWAGVKAVLPGPATLGAWRWANVPGRGNRACGLRLRAGWCL